MFRSDNSAVTKACEAFARSKRVHNGVDNGWPGSKHMEAAIDAYLVAANLPRGLDAPPPPPPQMNQRGHQLIQEYYLAAREMQRKDNSTEHASARSRLKAAYQALEKYIIELGGVE